MSQISLRIFALLGFLSLSSIEAMVFDNRHIPLLIKPLMIFEGAQSLFSNQGMFSTASRAYNAGEADMRLPEVFGLYDEGMYGHALMVAGFTNPLPTEWQGHGKISWNVDGKRQMQGVTFTWQQHLVDYLSMGFSWLFMHVNSRFTFHFASTNVFLGPGDQQRLDPLRRCMFSSVGLNLGNASQSGFGDIDSYLRIGNTWEYCLKFKRIDAGIRGGLIFPTGVRREIDKPASIPFGGNGHWGLYAVVDALFELKDDIKVGIVGRVQKRLPRTLVERLPVAGEPTIMGVLCGPVRVNPGVTVIVQPNVTINNLRPGLGVNVIYNLIHHSANQYRDMRVDRTVPVQLDRLKENSKWGADYVTVYVYYDFCYEADPRGFGPIVSFTWDIPASFYTANRNDKANRILLGLEFAY